MCEQWSKIVMARHGQTNQNAHNLLLSRMDDPLNELGRKQAYALKVNLQDYTFSKYYSSPLSRAFETAQIVAGADTPINREKRIIERDFGTLEGMSYIETEPVRTAFLEGQPESWNTNAYGIETDKKLDERVLPFLKEIAVAHLGVGPIFIATHSGIMRYLLNHLGITYTESRGKKIPNCSHIILESNGKDIRLAGVDNSPEFQWLRDVMYTKGYATTN